VTGAYSPRRLCAACRRPIVPGQKTVTGRAGPAHKTCPAAAPPGPAAPVPRRAVPHDLPALTDAHLRALLDSPAQDPVLYLAHSGDGLALDVWAEALVPPRSIVVRRDELLNVLTGVGPEQIDADDLLWAAGALGDSVGEAEPCPADHGRGARP